ncbi:hypothetical protein AMTR_s00065p00178210 [Amborella trichopoda]|uniref:Uncharacterized protein n=1 Tax=Amborella trichopoda TaxID=13333 RepID=U5D851_AMBTC|nr:hypothetical protein AMTR_s00065p00178210 [Amborella trichopoda]
MTIIPGEFISDSLKDNRGVNVVCYGLMVAPFPINHSFSKGLAAGECFQGKSFHVEEVLGVEFATAFGGGDLGSPVENQYARGGDCCCEWKIVVNEEIVVVNEEIAVHEELAIVDISDGVEFVLSESPEAVPLVAFPQEEQLPLLLTGPTSVMLPQSTMCFSHIIWLGLHQRDPGKATASPTGTRAGLMLPIARVSTLQVSSL